MKKLYNIDEPTKVIGVRVPRSMAEALKEPIRDYAKFLVANDTTYKELLEYKRKSERLREKIMEVIGNKKLEPKLEEFKDILNGKGGEKLDNR